MADEYEYKDPNTDMMKALSKAVDAATGKTGTQYEYKNPDTDVIQKLEELTGAITSGGGGGGSQIQSDWNQSDSSEVDYIKNKPTIPSTTLQEYTLTKEESKIGWVTKARAFERGGICFISISFGTGDNKISTEYTKCFSGAPIPETAKDPDPSNHNLPELTGISGGKFFKFYVDGNGDVYARYAIDVAAWSEVNVYGSYLC